MKLSAKDILNNPVTGYAAAGLIAIIVVWYASGKLEDFFSSDTDDRKVDPGEKDVEFDDNNLTFDPIQYDLFSDSLYEAMNYTGTNWSAILDVFSQLETDDDVLALINSYGVRTLYVFAIPTAPLNLNQSLVREQTGSFYGVEDVNEILSEKNISIRF